MNFKFKNVTFQEIKDRLNIINFYRQELGLGDHQIQQTGNNWCKLKVLCPFHNDSKPGSLHINTITGAFTCFSCGAKGNLFTFYMKKYHTDFKTALKQINERYL